MARSVKEGVYNFSLKGNTLSTVAGWSRSRFWFLAVATGPDLNGGFSVATPGCLRCGLTPCEALQSINSRLLRLQCLQAGDGGEPSHQAAPTAPHYRWWSHSGCPLILQTQKMATKELHCSLNDSIRGGNQTLKRKISSVLNKSCFSSEISTYKTDN